MPHLTSNSLSRVRRYRYPTNDPEINEKIKLPCDSWKKSKSPIPDPLGQLVKYASKANRTTLHKTAIGTDNASTAKIFLLFRKGKMIRKITMMNSENVICSRPAHGGYTSTPPEPIKTFCPDTVALSPRLYSNSQVKNAERFGNILLKDHPRKMPTGVKACQRKAIANGLRKSFHSPMGRFSRHNPNAMIGRVSDKNLSYWCIGTDPRRIARVRIENPRKAENFDGLGLSDGSWSSNAINIPSHNSRLIHCKMSGVCDSQSRAVFHRQSNPASSNHRDRRFPSCTLMPEARFNKVTLKFGDSIECPSIDNSHQHDPNNVSG